MPLVSSPATITALSQTADRMIRDIKAGRSTIGAVCALWNRLCHEADAPDLKIATPRLRSRLVELLTGKQWLLNYGDSRCADGTDPREWSGAGIEVAHAEALDAHLMREWATSNILIARTCEAAKDAGIRLYTAYRREFKECGGYVDAFTEMKIIPNERGTVDLWLRSSAVPAWYHDCTLLDPAGAYAVATGTIDGGEWQLVKADHS